MSVIPVRSGPTVPVALAALLAAGGLAACSEESPAPVASTSASAGTGAQPSPSGTSAGLDSYTDAGDGCAQAISAISYADDVLRPLGQEPYQEFDDVVRSRLAAVAGTLALEAEDWPDEPVHRQADQVQQLAEAAAARPANGSATGDAIRVNTLLRYRIEAGTLVLVCRDATPAPTSTPP